METSPVKEPYTFADRLLGNPEPLWFRKRWAYARALRAAAPVVALWKEQYPESKGPIGWECIVLVERAMQGQHISVGKAERVAENARLAAKRGPVRGLNWIGFPLQDLGYMISDETVERATRRVASVEYRAGLWLEEATARWQGTEAQ